MGGRVKKWCQGRRGMHHIHMPMAILSQAYEFGQSIERNRAVLCEALDRKAKGLAGNAVVLIQQ